MPATTTEARTVKRTRIELGLVTGVLAAHIGLGVSAARAETTQCTVIASLPTTITTQGIYCLTSDFNLGLASGNAITIEANNVVLDLNGHKIGNLSAGPGTFGVGVLADSRQNITVKNGTVRGFLTGVAMIDNPTVPVSQGHVIEDVRADQNTRAGIWVEGRGNVVRRNQVVATGGSTISPNSGGLGVMAIGPGNRVLDNDVITVTKSGTGVARGILFADSSDDGVAINNRITGADRGIEMTVASVIYRDNITTGVTTPYMGGTDAGNNH